MIGGPVSRTLAAASLAAVLAAGCGRPPDAAWLRFVGFKSGDKTISVVRCRLDGAFDEPTTAVDGTAAGTGNVDVSLQNASFIVGRGEDSGVGILVDRVRVTYSLAGSPAYDYPVTLYLPAPAKAGEAEAGTISDLPIVPASLERWVMANVSASEAGFGARVTVHAETDDGTDLETTGGISIVLTR